MSPLRTIAVLLVFLALAALELFNGLTRIETLREGRRRELFLMVERGHAGLARRLEDSLILGIRLAEHLARSVDIAAGRAAVQAELAIFMQSFENVDGVTVRVPDGKTLIALGAHAEDPRPEPGSEQALVAGAGARVPPLDPDADTADSSIRLTRSLPGPDGPAGWVELSLSAQPFLQELMQYQPLPGARSRIEAVHDDDGFELCLIQRADGGFDIVSHLQHSGDRVLVTTVPGAALEAAMAPLHREFSWIIGSMVAVTLVLALVAAIILRLSQRAFRLHETEHYLRWIRRVTDRYRALMEGAADMILILAPDDGSIREANAAAREALGLGSDDPDDVAAAARSAVSLFDDADRGRFDQALESAVTSGQPVAAQGLHIHTAEQDELVVDGHFALVDLGDEHIVEVSLRDVTRQRAIESQLQTAERLGSLGLLTAGVAHEINNPLEGIGNYLALLNRTQLGEDDRQRYLQSVRDGFDRIRNIVQDLLSFARPTVESGRADLSDVATNALNMAAYSKAFRNIDVECVGLDEPLPVAGDSRRLEQVVLNLLLNAERAMDGSGRIVLRGQRDPDDSWIELSVEDEGPGIPAEQLDRIFDPFFSEHGGTGLGLSVSFGIVKAHGGLLSATNRPQGGAAFVLRLQAFHQESVDTPVPATTEPAP